MQKPYEKPAAAAVPDTVVAALGTSSAATAAQAGSMREVQQQWLSDLQRFGHNWLDRRQEAMLSGMELAARVSRLNRTDSTEAFHLMQQWWVQSFNRLALDVQEGTAIALRASSLMAKSAPAAASTAATTSSSGKMAAA